MSAIYILWLRELKRYSRSRAQIVASLGQPLLYLLALGFGLGPVFQKAGQGSYLQFVAPGVIGMTVLFTSIFSGHRPAVGPAVRLPEGDARRARAAAADHGRPHARRRDGRDDPGHAGADRLPDRRLPAAHARRRCRWRCCSWR